MDDELHYPTMEAAKSVLIKIGVDPSTRFDVQDQDFMYTSCKVDEINQYIKLYEQKDTTPVEKRVLGCFLLECLNEYFEDNKKGHPLQSHAFKLLHNDTDVHESELKYWTNTSDTDEDHWWPITKELLKWRNT
ncbi:MAG: hypothetical protein ABIK28_07315 [Planctomycetota bacterium]